MRIYFFITTILITYHIVPVKVEKYDLLIIPIARKEPSAIKIPSFTSWPHINSNKKSIETKKVLQEKLKLDIEPYEDPTDSPDIDNFDYNVDRYDDQKRSRVAFAYDEPLDNPTYGDDKIVGGVEVEINLYPYHVAYGTNCGGAIIDKKWILTAGHCGKKPYVRVGSKYLNAGKKVAVKRSVIHPMWHATKKEHPFDFDFQLLELSEPLKFDENVQPIKVAHIEDMVIGKVVTVTGWGNTEENGPYSNVLKAVRVPIISKENCQSVPFPYFRGSLTARMFCAGFAEGKKDACQGDSGGPAVSNDRLLGMVSFGYGCATPGSYGVYSKVAKVRDWITSITGIRVE